MNLRLISNAFLHWLANYGLSLCAADYAFPGPEDRVSGCPLAQWFEPQKRNA